MAATSPKKRPTPEHILNTLNAYQRTAALRAGIELDVFTAIGEGANTVSLLTGKTRASARGLRSLSDALAALGFLEKEDGRYALTEESAMFLDRRSPAYLGSAIGFIGRPEFTRNFASLTESVRRGATATEDEGGKPDNPFWVEFARSMAAMSVPTANFIAELIEARKAEPMKVLDLAASHGNFGITIARKNPNARIVGVDWAPVLEVARENARAAGVEERYQLLAGSAFETQLGMDYDLVLVTNLLQLFDQATNVTLLRRVREALKPGGRAVMLGYVPNEDRITPPAPAMFTLTMLVTTTGGDAYPYSEYAEMFREAGFAETTLHDVPDNPHRVLVSRRPK